MSGRRPALAVLVFVWLLPRPATALDFLFSWRADPDPGCAGYAVFRRTGDALWENIAELPLSGLEDPTHPVFLVTGLSSGTTYRFAVSSRYASGTESALYAETCIRVGEAIAECGEDEKDGTTLFVSCFLSAAAENSRREGPRR